MSRPPLTAIPVSTRDEDIRGWKMAWELERQRRGGKKSGVMRKGPQFIRRALIDGIMLGLPERYRNTPYASLTITRVKAELDEIAQDQRLTERMRRLANASRPTIAADLAALGYKKALNKGNISK